MCLQSFVRGKLCFISLCLQNFKKEVQRIADYLKIQVTDAMLETIQCETSFANMKQKKHDITIPISRDGKSTIYRKGIGLQRKNHFLKN